MAVSEKPVVLVDDEDQILLSYSTILKTAGMDNIITIQDSKKVMPFLMDHEASVVVLDLIMPHLSGGELLNKIKNDYPNIPVIVMTAINDIEMAVNCMKAGAFDYLVKPVEKSRFISSLHKAFEILELQVEVCNLKHHLLSEQLNNREAFSSIITQSRKMISVFHYIEAIAGSDRPVCISGETGVGKELLARATYNISGRTGYFVAVNVAGLDDTMFSDTLFGHKKGAFSGADSDRDGLIAKAGGGSLMLDEIGDLNEHSQLKLLRLLEERQYYPLGSDVSHKSNVRIIATTNKDLKNMVANGRFRKDLYYRLCTHLIQIPPLRERLEDIPLLLDHFLDEASLTLSKRKPYYPDELITLLSGYHFPGNIRELQTMIVDAVARHKSGKLSMGTFKHKIRQNDEAVPTHFISSEKGKLSETPGQSGVLPTLKESEAYLISEALKRSEGNQRRAAEMLGISRQALNKRLKRSEQS
ncbi:MAG: sigma-54-dependent Fis family transcriptional regulator [Nitrospiraceae bacterium]|nr:MAG: sigma-54-dependent Fis family transcriptional regulator [Nitrospiraceae bacterium]